MLCYADRVPSCGLSGVAMKGLFEEDVGSWSDRVIE